MPLALPPADERTFSSLVADARAKIPRFAPSWTDQNAHDPGITLIELLAYLTETDLYRLSRVTAAHRRAFLRWFGLESRGPTVAESVVALVWSAALAAASDPIGVPADCELRADDGAIIFSTTSPLRVQPGKIAGLFTGERLLRGSDEGGVSIQLGAPAAVLGLEGKSEFAIAFDGRPVGEVSLYFWTGSPDHDAGVRRRLEEELTATRHERPRQACACTRDWTRHYEVDLVWEAYAGGGWVALPAESVVDETRALSLSGFVRLVLPNTLDLAPGGLRYAPAAHAIRARAIRGEYELAPLLQAVLLNAVRVRHQSRSFDTELGTSNGRAGQSLRVPRSPEKPVPGPPLVSDQTRVRVVTDEVAEVWTVAADWDRARPNDSIAVLDASAGTLFFGDGRAGRVPPAGARIELSSRVGGGAAGNAEPGTLTRLFVDATRASPTLDVVQPFAARGGGPPPSLQELEGRLLGELARPTRAVTLTDYEQLARETPGVRVARARAVADFHPQFSGLPALGSVTVVVVPEGGGRAPQPSRGLLCAVRAYLGRRRALTSELHVVGPTYQRLAVRAVLHLQPNAAAVAVVNEAERRIDAFFHPLTGGADGAGWPIGRDVHRSEVFALLQGVPGVHHTEGLSLLVGSGRAPSCGNVSVCASDLIATQPHELSTAPARSR